MRNGLTEACRILVSGPFINDSRILGHWTPLGRDVQGEVITSFGPNVVVTYQTNAMSDGGLTITHRYRITGNWVNSMMWNAWSHGRPT